MLRPSAEGGVRCALGQAGAAEVTLLDWGLRADGGGAGRGEDEEADEVEEAEGFGFGGGAFASDSAR